MSLAATNGHRNGRGTGDGPSPSRRALVEDLAVPVPLGSLLPDLYRRHDDNVLRFTEALDEVVAPVWLVLDNYDAHLDPLLAPLDLVELVAGWVGFPLDRNWSPAQTRRLVATAVELYRRRGTRRGIEDLVKAYTGVVPTISDSGGTTWSTEPGSRPPGAAEPSVRVLVELPEQAPADLAQLTRLIAANVPAHVGVSVEIRRSAAVAPIVEPTEPAPRPAPVAPPLPASSPWSVAHDRPPAPGPGGNGEPDPYGSTGPPGPPGPSGPRPSGPRRPGPRPSGPPDWRR
jgi:phage tail-like protein